MFYIDALDIEIAGQTVTFDVVTGYGLICAAVFFTGFVVSIAYERWRKTHDYAVQPFDWSS